jgi:hypothetical protein
MARTRKPAAILCSEVVRRLAAFGKGGGDSSLPPPKSDDFQTERVGALNDVVVERWPNSPDSKNTNGFLAHTDMARVYTKIPWRAARLSALGSRSPESWVSLRFSTSFLLTAEVSTSLSEWPLAL